MKSRKNGRATAKKTRRQRLIEQHPYLRRATWPTVEQLESAILQTTNQGGL